MITKQDCDLRFMHRDVPKEFTPSMTKSDLVEVLSKNQRYLAPKDVEVVVRSLINILSRRAYSPVSITPSGQYRYNLVEVKIDEKVLIKIAEITDGQYFRATDNHSLADIYKEIDKLEKTKIEVTQHSRKSDRFFNLALVALGLVLGSYVLNIFVLRFTP